MPRLNGSRTTYAPRSAAMPAVRSVEPSSTTTTSKPWSNARISSITRPMVASSFSAGTTARRLSSASCARIASRGGAGASASSATRRHRCPKTDKFKNLARPVRIRVLVEDALACTPAHCFRRPRIVEQLAIDRERLVGRRDDAPLRSRLEPPLYSLLGVRDDRRSRRRELERATGGRRVNRRVRAPRDVEVDSRARDRLREDVERNVADHARAADVAAEVLAAEREVDVGIAAARFADELAYPLTPELVTVAVEEDVVLLLDGSRLEQLRIDRPKHGLGAARAELAQTPQSALGVREHGIVLGRVGAVVVVEARVHPAELRQAHGHVAVVEDDRNAEAFAQMRR